MTSSRTIDRQRSGFSAGRRWWLIGGLLLAASWAASGQESRLFGEAPQQDRFFPLRRTMVDEQVRQRGVEEPGVLAAMERVPRHLFVPEAQQTRAYEDEPLSIAPGQTLSQAFVSARMIELLELDGGEKVLEIGTGSGYEAAILSGLAREVCTVEIDEELGRKARKTLERLGYANVRVRIGDGYRGWEEEAPFDAILVTASTQRIPPPLIDQLAPGGKMVVAVGSTLQELRVVTKTVDGYTSRPVSLVNITPMTGEVTRED